MKVNTITHGPVTPHALICAGQGEHARLLIGYYPSGSYHVVDYLTGMFIVDGRYFGRTLFAALDLLGPYTRGAITPSPDAIQPDPIKQDDVADAYCRVWFERARVGRVKAIKVLRFKNTQP